MSYAIFVAPDEASGAGLFSFIVVGNGVTIILYRLRGIRLRDGQEARMAGTKKSGRQLKRDSVCSDRLRYFEERLPAMLETIRAFVEIESPSDNKAAADRMGAFLAGIFEELGGRARLHPSGDYGDNLQIDFGGRDGRKPVLLLGHFDTVYPLGTLANMPCRKQGDRLHGPGVLDMKGGLVVVAFALRGLAEAYPGGLSALPPLRIVVVSD